MRRRRAGRNEAGWALLYRIRFGALSLVEKLIDPPTYPRGHSHQRLVEAPTEPTGCDVCVGVEPFGRYPVDCFKCGRTIPAVATEPTEE